MDWTQIPEGVRFCERFGRRANATVRERTGPGFLGLTGGERRGVAEGSGGLHMKTFLVSWRWWRREPRDEPDPGEGSLLACARAAMPAGTRRSFETRRCYKGGRATHA